MSDTSYEMDLGTDILWEGDFAEQANPGPPLPAEELQPLVVDVFGMDDNPRPLEMGDLSPSYSGLVFPGAEPSKPDLSAFLMDSTVPKDVRERIYLAVQESHEDNLSHARAMDQKFCGLYTITEGLVNNSMEAIRGFGKVAAALDIRQ